MAQVPSKSQKRGIGSSGSAVSPKQLNLATLDVTEFHCNPSTKGFCRCQYYPQCQVRSAVILLLMRCDRIPTVRSPFSLLIGQPDGRLGSRRGPDIGVSNQISPSKSMYIYVCVCAKWLLGAHVLMAASVCVEMKINEWGTRATLRVDKTEGPVERTLKGAHASFCLCVCECQVIPYLLCFHHLFHRCWVQNNMGELRRLHSTICHCPFKQFQL